MSSAPDRGSRVQSVDDVFTAVANRHRRRLLDLLLDEPQSVSALAARFDMRRPGVSEHLKVLKDAGLVSEARHGRERIYRVDAERLRAVAAPAVGAPRTAP
ncbi:helix-turn-helix transcriptional regulator [Nocardioides sp.]|uniref:ArsR/SmtB family transcription factor n=1 Tax=Nocardioides sp. TaxID=35761 RepID=UPI0027335AD7|nr:metalloregulator ArsR/SmtB family transcription factor [Nocardioides sp.]MDP3890826.1 metalloregulator ArsR/SmtB family transcription factor [Nocardioides sp.]